MKNTIYITLSNIYKYIVNYRNRLYDKNKVKIIKLPVPVFSIGNICVGGTGKTPFAVLLAQMLVNNSKKPAIIAKGYKRKKKNINIVSDGKNILCDIDSAGDEAYFIAEKINIPVVIHVKKYIASQIALNSLDIDCIILDDGFQHRKLNRDLDIVLLNNFTFENVSLIPLGRLRETIDSINRANIIAIPKEFRYFEELKKYNFSNIIIFKRIINKIYELFNLNIIIHNDLYSKQICLISSIASPEQFEAMLVDLNINPIMHFKFPDHHNYILKELIEIKKFCLRNGIKYIITTEKDAVKLKKFKELFADSNFCIYVCQLELSITEGYDLLQGKVDEIFGKYQNL